MCTVSEKETVSVASWGTLGQLAEAIGSTQAIQTPGHYPDVPGQVPQLCTSCPHTPVRHTGEAEAAHERG